MHITVHLAFIVWFLLSLLLFAFRPPRQAVIASFIIGFLFLPHVGYDVPMLHRKTDIISTGVLLCVFLFHFKYWRRLRLGLFDLPMIVWCLCPYVSAVVNGRGVYDAVSAALENILRWGIPYFIGRVYLTDAKALRDLAVGVLAGGIIYVPFCFWELRMSPQLHRIVYGFHPHEAFAQSVRYGGYRPNVFLQHGLAVAVWMSLASLAGFWLWRSGALKKLWGIPIAWLVVLLAVTTILCKSLNAMVLLAVGCLVYIITKNLRSAIPILVLLALPPLYMVLRTTGSWSGESLVYYTGQTVNDERADSLQFRMDHETRLLQKALQQKVFGWSGWGRSRVFNAEGVDVSVTDGIWVIAFGVTGLVGLISWALAMTLPVIVLLRRCPVRWWAHRNIAPAGVLAVVLCLHMIDNLFNALVCPVFSLAAAGLVGLKKESIVAALKARPLVPASKGRLRPMAAPIAHAQPARG